MSIAKKKIQNASLKYNEQLLNILIHILRDV